MFEGDGYPTAAVAMERIYGFLVAHPDGRFMMTEWRVAREGLATVSDYHQVVSRLASASARLCDPVNDEDKRAARCEVIHCIEKLQNVSPTP